MMNKSLLSLSLSLLLLASCNPSPVIAPTPTPTPTATPTPAPVFKGLTTLSGTVAIDAQSVTVEASNASGSFRKAVAAVNKAYSISDVPIGERIRVQAQYKNNPGVILSALVEAGPEQKEKTTTLNIDAQSTAIDLIYSRAASISDSAIVKTSLADFMNNAAVTSYRNQLLQVLQEILSTPIDNIVVAIPTAPKVTQTLDSIVPAIEAILKNQPIPTPTPVVTPNPNPTPSAGPSVPSVFTPVRLVLKPGKDITIARDTNLKFWVAAVDAFGNQQAVNATWATTNGSSHGTLGSDGLFVPSTAGDHTFSVTYGNLVENGVIHVTDADLQELEIIPDKDISLTVGQSFELQAKGKDEKGRDVLVSPTWTLSNNFVGQINANGVFIPLQPGRVDLTARAHEFTSTVTISVEASSAFIIEVSPNQPTVLPGKFLPIQVLGLDLTNNTASAAFSFSVSDPSIGTFLGQDTSINGITPTAMFQALKPGTVQVSVRDVLSDRTSTFPVVVAEGVPHVSGMSPASSPLTPGQTITIIGENFSSDPNANQVLFNSIPGKVLSSSPTSMTVTVPIGSFTGFVTVVTEGRRGSSYPFVITPRVDNVIPTEAGEGELVTITGEHFSTDNPAHNAVFFDSERASVPVNVTNSSMQVRVPPGLDSDVQVTVRVKGQISNLRDFTVAGASIPNWTEEDNAPTSRSGAMAEVIDGDIYVIGGYQSSVSDRLEIYDVGDDTWSTGASLPDESAGLATVMLDDEIYAIGGDGGSQTIYRYDPDNDDWTELDFETDQSHVGAVAEAYQGKIYIIGGEGSNGRVVEECDPDGASDPDDACELKQSSPTRRFEAASALYNGRIYVIGGGEDTTEDRITAYDIEDDEWITGLTPMPKKLRRAAAVVINSKIYVIGGEDETGRESDNVYEYTPGTSAWRTLKRLPSARSGPAAGAVSSRLYVIGGESSGGDTENTNFRGQF